MVDQPFTPLTIRDIYYGIGILVASITIGGTLLKFVFAQIDLRWHVKKAEQFDALYVKKDDMHQILMPYINAKSLAEFCLHAQSKCPRGNDVHSLIMSAASVADTMKEVVREQKILRQETLPEKYTSMILFKDTIDRIEESIDKAINEFRNTAKDIFDRVNELSKKQ